MGAEGRSPRTVDARRGWNCKDYGRCLCIYAELLSARGFTDVYADLRFVLSAGTHCPRNYYSAVAAAFRHPRASPSPFRSPCSTSLLLATSSHLPRAHFPPWSPEISNFTYALWKILRPRFPPPTPLSHPLFADKGRKSEKDPLIISFVAAKRSKTRRKRRKQSRIFLNSNEISNFPEYDIPSHLYQCAPTSRIYRAPSKLSRGENIYIYLKNYRKMYLLFSRNAHIYL